MINCPAIPENLLESELFGHAKGAFTGADSERIGLLVESDGGTICLDEIGDIPVSIQTKLLRFLQESEVRPLGSTKTAKVDVRVVAMTNQNLEQKIADGQFRSDLFYRLNVVTVQTPCLRDISEDLPLLVNHFVHLACVEQNISPKSVEPAVVKDLTRLLWPGNVRELQNLLRRAVMYSKSEEIVLKDIENMGLAEIESPAKSNFRFDGIEQHSYKDAKENIMRAFSTEYLNSLLKRTNGNVTKAASISSLSRAAFQKIMLRYQITAESFRGN
jgi:DNA-binding NtrC family response regulator